MLAVIVFNLSMLPSFASSEEVDTLGPLIIEETLEPPIINNTKRSETTLGAKEIESRQPENIYKLIEGIPGVLLEGGPRTSGTTLNIRGFSDNEDIMVKIDGAVKNFEKYRYGSGVSIEPELLKSVTVRRGALGLSEGTGTLGGAIIMTTKDASDFLRDGEQYGARLKAGYTDNNNEWMYSGTAYGTPTEWMDVVFNITKREADDYELSTGEDLENSAESPRGILAKTEFYPSDSTIIGFSFTENKRNGREYFDALTTTGSFGEVLRDVKERSYTTNIVYSPESNWVDLSADIGFSDIQLDETRINPDGTPIELFGEIQTNKFEYDIYSFSFANTSTIETNNWQIFLNFGADYINEERLVESTSFATDQAQPDGETETLGVYFTPEIIVGSWSFNFGIRRDFHEVETTSQPTIDTLDSFGLPSKISENKTLYSFGAEYSAKSIPVTYFAQYREAVRYPKLDEYFTDSFAFSDCGNPANRPDVPLDYTNNWPQICSDVYMPEFAETYEAGFSYSDRSRFNEKHRINTRLTLYYTTVEDVLDSLRPDENFNFSQPGEEERKGLELEASYATAEYVAYFSYSKMDAEETGWFLPEGEIPNYYSDVYTTRDIYNIPRDTWAFNLTRVQAKYGLEYGFRFRYIDEYPVLVEDPLDDDLTIEEDQRAYYLLDLHASWKPTDSLKLTLDVDNATNQKYRVSAFDGLGNYNVGKSIKVTAAYQF